MVGTTPLPFATNVSTPCGLRDRVRSTGPQATVGAETHPVSATGPIADSVAFAGEARAATARLARRAMEVLLASHLRALRPRAGGPGGAHDWAEGSSVVLLGWCTEFCTQW